MADADLRLAEPEMTAFAGIVADVDRIAAWVRAAGLSYADEPATCFKAPVPERNP
jgi:hypothetical protein